MTKKMGYRWHLRRPMAEREMFQTSDLGPLSASGASPCRASRFFGGHRPPQRMSMDILAALCDILGCGVQDLIEIVEVNEQVRKSAASSGTPAPWARKTTIRRP